MVNLTCNPYNNELRTSCTVSGPSLDFTIHWFWQNTGGNITEIDGSKVQNQTLSDAKTRSQLFFRNLANRTGLFWCQVRLATGIELEGSSRLILLEESFYLEQSFVTCGLRSAKIFSEQTSRCIFSFPATEDTTIIKHPTTSPTITTSVLRHTSPTTNSVGPFDASPWPYIVIAIVVIFFLVIISLTVGIVFLYRDLQKKSNTKDKQQEPADSLRESAVTATDDADDTSHNSERVPTFPNISLPQSEPASTYYGNLLIISTCI